MDDFKKILELHLQGKQSTRMFKKGVKLIGNNAANFVILMDMLKNGNIEIKKRAAAVLGRIGEKYPHLLTLHFDGLMELLDDLNQHNAVHRAIARSYQYYTLSLDEQGIFYEIGIKQLQHYSAAVAVKAFLIKSLHNIAVQHPSLQREFNLVLDEMEPKDSAGLISRRKKFYFYDS